ncbi:FlgD immunoglobulin-like domain containing protein [Ekhidna sp.]|uniref:FlgD immunoglobulin-like domain containing protein n=1 Tax=Ekhidna sp. TaxID=2608089 RepID=UPI003299B011
MKKFLWFFLIVFLLFKSEEATSPEYVITIDQTPSEIEGSEDLMGRNEYFQLMTKDPKTGAIPPNIRRAELRFAKQLAVQNPSGRSQQLNVASLGPTNVGGRTRAVAFDVRDENVILAGGVSGSIWKSVDGGISWTRKSDPENRNSITCLVQDTRPGKEDTWYHGTGEIVGNSARGGGAPFRGDGIYKSTDNGESWDLLVSTQDSDPSVFNSQFQYIWDIETNPGNLAQDEVLIAAFGGILRSVDGGDSWEVVLGQKLFDLPDTANLNNTDASFFTSLERSVDNVFYAGLSTEAAEDRQSPDAGLYFSLDAQNWTNITPLTEESKFGRAVIGSSPSNPDITYFMLDSSPIFILEHKRSLINSPTRINGFDPEPRIVPDFAETLGDLNTQGSYNMMIRVHPDNSDIVFIGGTNLYRSTDAFRTKENIEWIGGYNPEGGSGIYPNHHPDQHELLFTPSNPDVALSASDGGLILTENILADSVVWQSRNDGFITSQFFTVAQSKAANDPTILGGMQDNGTDLSGGSTSWTGILGGDGSYAATTNNNALWFTSFQRGQVLRLTLNDEYKITSFGRIDPGNLVKQSASVYLFINPFTLDPTNQNRMFCAGGNHLYFHPNVSQIPGGSQKAANLGWVKVNNFPISNGLISAVEPSFNGDRIYFGTSEGEVFRVINAKSEVNFLSSTITGKNLPKESYVSSISVDPEDDQHLIVVFSNYEIPSIFESFNGGITYTDISGNLEENVDGSGNGPSIRWAEIIPKTSGNLILVGTSVGLYSTETTNGENTVWTKESVGQIGSSIVTMMDYRSSDGRLVIATHGNGVYETFIDSFKKLTLDTPTESFTVNSAYPNPFMESTHIEYTIPEDGEVRIDILTTGGELINTILWGPQFAGSNAVVWDGNNSSGTSLANGMYLYRIQYKGESLSGRLVLRR